eukprot:g7864.t1
MAHFRSGCGAKGLLGIALVFMGRSLAQQAGSNECLTDRLCGGGDGYVNLSNCGLTNPDIDDLSICFDTYGREYLTHLDLAMNSLDSIPNDFLKGMDNLERVNLEDNGIVELPPGLLDHTPKLTTISLPFNRMASLAPNLFKNTPNIREVRINDNHLSSLPYTIFDGLAINRMSAFGNKLHCFPPMNHAKDAAYMYPILDEGVETCERPLCSLIPCSSGIRINQDQRCTADPCTDQCCSEHSVF